MGWVNHRVETRKLVRRYAKDDEDHASEKALMSRILNINFPRLKKLSLSYVGMETIEGISRIFMPLL